MDVIYFFLKSESGSRVTRVPFFNHNRELFIEFIKHGGSWDKARHEFIFLNDAAVDRMIESISGIPIVMIDESGRVKPVIHGFFERPWDSLKNVNVHNVLYNNDDDYAANVMCNQDSVNKTDNSRQPVYINHQKDENIDQPFNFPASPALPEKFSSHWVEKLETELRARKYSPQTRKSYIFYNRLICRSLQKTPEEIRPDDVTEFLAIMEKNRDYSASSINLAISSIKFFFRNVLRNDAISEQHRPRHDERLPMVLSKEEITKVLSMEKNPKHRLLLMLVYSSGLRVSEVVALKKEHIDFSRKVIYIRQGKGRKDRSTLLSEKAAAYIEEYYDFFGIEKWIFPGQPPTRHLTIRSAQQIFDKAVRRAGITKKITIHGLRHTFATHLLECGTDIRYIQTLLGHSNLRTTERYTHVAKRSVLNIKSPLDTI